MKPVGIGTDKQDLPLHSAFISSTLSNNRGQLKRSLISYLFIFQPLIKKT
jgi:hypothetical protein